jgi:hypothetical protein
MAAAVEASWARLSWPAIHPKSTERRAHSFAPSRKTGKASAGRKIIDLASEAPRSEQEMRDLVGATEQIVREIGSSDVYHVRVHADHLAARLASGVVE